MIGKSPTHQSHIWSGIPPVDETTTCDICSSNQDVSRNQLEVTEVLARGREHTGDYHQSNLCKACKDKGWLAPATADSMSGLLYLNSQTDEQRSIV